MRVGAVAELGTRGFVVLRNFLSSDELALLRDDFSRSVLDVNGNYNLKVVSTAATELLAPKVQDVTTRVTQETTVTVNTFGGSVYFQTGGETGVAFPWHQDHESYFIFQTHYNYLNFYMPIIKPDPEKSNVSLIPFDLLERELPDVHRRLYRSGACHFQEVGGRLVWLSDETGRIRVMPKQLESLACTPALAAGDLLLMRGDIVHRTQDADTDRVALSIRMVDDGTVIRRSRLSSGGLRKALMMSKYALVYQMMFEAFEHMGRDAMTLGELRSTGEKLDLLPTASRRAFLLQLLGEKRRAHQLTRLALDTPRTVGVTAAARAQGRYRRIRTRRAA